MFILFSYVSGLLKDNPNLLSRLSITRYRNKQCLFFFGKILSK